MKLVSFLNQKNEERLGLSINNHVIDAEKNATALGLSMPSTMSAYLRDLDTHRTTAQKIHDAVICKKTEEVERRDSMKPLAPLPRPTSCRDAYAFRQHVATARRNRGLDMIPEFDQFPVFYFTNHNAIFGEGTVEVELDHLERLDFELEIAIIIGKAGKNIQAKDADEYIAGYTIMNDLSARTLQMEEMRLNLGPAKGKDFATTIGPWMVTPDELDPYKIKTPAGNKYNLEMTATHNGKRVSQGNFKDMNWTFAEIIERASYGVELHPGDVIGSGTVGTGCYLELNGTQALEAKKSGVSFTPTWLQNGDTIELEITGLGKLTNTIKVSPSKKSILKKKKNV